MQGTALQIKMANYICNKLRMTQNEHRFTKFDRSVSLNLKPISYFYAFIQLVFYLETIGVS